MKENNDDFGLLDIDSNKYNIKKKFNFFFSFNNTILIYWYLLLYKKQHTFI